MSDPCLNTFTVKGRWIIFECGHSPAEHDEDGCLECACGRYIDDNDPSDSYLLRDSESIGGGGARDTDASYRSEMRDAGRGSLLR